MGRVLEEAIAPERASSRFTVLLGLVALLLVSVGVYGLLANSVSERTSEIGIRIALGAESSSVIGMFMRDTVRLLSLGAAVGLLAAFAVARLIANILFGVRVVDPASVTAAILVLAFVSLFAAWLPARRASRLDPMQALRHE
jgi:ABC-type antimicrobial peptide transport system permease subunit